MKNVLVTGGGGFVGKKIIQLLQKKGINSVALGRNRYPELEDNGIKCLQGDIGDRDFILDNLMGYDTVFHVAACAGMWGKWEDFYSANVIGTRNIIDGCLKNNVPVMVYTSTPSVVFDRKDIISGDESLPYPSSFLCHYARSKSIAEKEALQVDQSKLKTCAIRPHLIWGPDDPHLIPRLIERGKKGLLKIVGDGSNLVDLTYVDNVAHAHILAAENLHDKANASANSYFIGQERPVNLWNWVNELFQHLDIPPVTQKISLRKALIAGQILETFHSLFMPSKEPRMTRFIAEQLAKSHYFSHAKAERDLGYHPIISLEEGLEHLLDWVKK